MSLPDRLLNSACEWSANHPRITCFLIVLFFFNAERIAGAVEGLLP